MAKNNKVEISLEEKLKQALVPVDEQPYTIPSNWVWTRLGNIYNLFTGNSIPESKKTTKYINLSNGYKYIATKDISYNGEINYENGVIIPYNEEKFKVAKARSSLLCIEGGSAGRKVGIVDRDVCFVNKLCCFESNSNLESKIIYYYIKSENFLSLFRENMNGLIGGVSLGNLKKIEFPLPPLNEQKRIVEKLDFLFEKTKRAKEIIEEVKVDIENRKISILDRAFKGTLTSKWRNENKTSDVKELLKSINDEKIKKWEEDCLQAEKDDNKKPKKPIIKEVKDMIVPVDEQPYKLPDSWVWTRWKEVTEIFSARRVLQEDWKKEGIPFYRAREIIKLSINGYVDNELFISEEHYLKLLKISRIPKTNDLMVSAVGTLGSTYVVKSEDKFYYKDASVLCVSPKKDINSYYLKYLMESFYMKEQIKLNSKGSTVDTLTISKYENFFIPLPPLEEQQEIVRVLDGVLENENKVKELLELEERIEILEKSILHKAFKGELGTQNNCDESALNLLKSIL